MTLTPMALVISVLSQTVFLPSALPCDRLALSWNESLFFHSKAAYCSKPWYSRFFESENPCFSEIFWKNKNAKRNESDKNRQCYP
ncbi:MAG: hypothetical protein H6R17_1098 [Proteobacteria bacterium]|nr:hypothetical protein [Pseudomonadota bacterium]